MEFSLLPYENNIYFHSGNPEITEFKCDVSNLLLQPSIVKPYCEFIDVVTDSLPGNQLIEKQKQRISNKSLLIFILQFLSWPSNTFLTILTLRI